MSEPSNALLNRLLRGISTAHVQTVRQAWRELLDEREIATPLVLEKLCSDVWRDKPLGPSTSYLGVLLALLHELDSEEFIKEIQRLRAEPLHPLHKHTIEMMAKRHNDQIFGNINNQVPVYISREIDQPDLVFNCLQRWSQTRDLALSKVTRVDVIAFHPEMDYLGKYNFFYDGIVLTWQNEVSSGFARWWRKTSAELTFYHEIGHHYFQHSESGQVKEQEREADDYQRLMFRSAHPILDTFLRVTLSPVLLALKLSRYLSKERSSSDT
jgi:hypothetical protein